MVRDLAQDTSFTLNSNICFVQHLVGLDASHVALVGETGVIIYRVAIGLHFTLRIPLETGDPIITKAKVVGDFILLWKSTQTLEFNWKTGIQTRVWSVIEPNIRQILIDDPKQFYPGIPLIVEPGKEFIFPGTSKSFCYPTFEAQVPYPLHERTTLLEKNLILVATISDRTCLHNLDTGDWTPLTLSGDHVRPLVLLKQLDDAYWTIVGAPHNGEERILYVLKGYGSWGPWKILSEVYEDTVWRSEGDFVSKVFLSQSPHDAQKFPHTGITKVVNLGADMLLMFTKKRMCWYSPKTQSRTKFENYVFSRNPHAKVVIPEKKVVVIDRGCAFVINVDIKKNAVWIAQKKELFKIETGALDRLKFLFIGTCVVLTLDGIVISYDWETNSTFHKIIEK